jgi:hypothetical protein
MPELLVLGRGHEREHAGRTEEIRLAVKGSERTVKH